MKKIALIPIDNRPVCYTLPKQIADIDDEIEVILPERKHLGGLTKPANILALLDWLEKLPDVDYVIISLDTIAYGGLVSSRRSEESFDSIKSRVTLLKNILQHKKCKTLAFSSVMRISNNNINEEEKEYWADYGQKIFEYSYNLHKMEKTLDSELNNKCMCISARIPQEVLDDYLMTRNRNFRINMLYLDLLSQKVFDTLVFSKDDCAEYGLNVKEANVLKEKIKERNLNAFVKTGADEIPLSLLSRAVIDGKNVKIAHVFLSPVSIGKISKYEDISVLESVKSQIELSGATYSSPEFADLILYVNNFKKQQGEIVMDVFEPGNDNDFKPANRPYFVADILNANGADNIFVSSLLENNLADTNFYGYTAWNTTGNTLGSAICTALTKYLARDVDNTAFKKLQMIRFLDDWAYQGKIRQKMKRKFVFVDVDYVTRKMRPYEKTLSEKLKFYPTKVEYSFPWDRSFEIEVSIE